MIRRPLLLSIVVIAAALIVLPVAVANSQAAPALHYRLVVYGTSGGPAPSGTIVRIVNASTGAICDEQTTINGLVEVEVDLTSACPAGAAIQVTVVYPGQDAVTRPVTPPIEWRAPAPGDPQPITVGVGGDGPPVLTSPQSPPRIATPGPPQLASGCGSSGPAAHGGQPVGLSGKERILRVTLPGGGLYFTQPALPSTGVIGLIVCSVDTDASVVISAETGQEVSRTTHDAAGDAIIDQIVASATLTTAPQAEAPPLRLIPPTTGDAGLK